MRRSRRSTTGSLPAAARRYLPITARPWTLCVRRVRHCHGERPARERLRAHVLPKGKHVLVEKPIALSTVDAEAMVREAEQRGNARRLPPNRFNPPVQELRRALDAGRFGRLVNGTARILWNRTMPYYEQAPWRGTWAQDGGTLMNPVIHGIDLLQWSLGGEPETVMAMTGNFLRDIEAEDFGAILVRFKKWCDRNH